MILGQLLANPGSGGEQDLAPLSLHSPGQWGRTVWNLEVAARQKQVGWVFSPLRQPAGLWRADQGERHLLLHHSGNGDEGILVYI